MALDSRSTPMQIMRPSSPRHSLTGDAIIAITNDGPTETGVKILHGHVESKRENKRRLAEERKAVDALLQETITIPMSEFPIGYPLQAAFQSSGPSCSLYRAFDYLHSRVILELQDELRCLEEDLADMDADDAYSSNPRQQRRVRSRDADLEEALEEAIHNNQPSDQPSPRAALLAKIRIKLVEYDEILMKSRALAEFQRPSNRDYLNVRRWFWNWKPLSYECEEEFIRRKRDLITLWPQAEFGKFDVLIGDCVQKMPSWLAKFFERSEQINDDCIRYYSAPRINKLTTLIIAFVIIVLLAVPVFVMYRVSWGSNRAMTLLNIGLLIIFTLLFSVSMSLLTRARRAELFAASAAYCAVLIVFIGNFSGGNGGPTGT